MKLVQTDPTRFAESAERIRQMAAELRQAAGDRGEYLQSPPVSIAGVEAWAMVEAAVFLDAAVTVLSSSRPAPESPVSLSPVVFTVFMLSSVSRSLLSVRNQLGELGAFASGVGWCETETAPTALELHASAASATIETLDEAIRCLDEAGEVWTDEAAAQWYKEHAPLAAELFP